VATKLETMYGEAAQARERLQFFLDEMAWKKGKTEEEIYQTAICSGMLALCKLNEIVVEMMLQQAGAVGPAPAKEGWPIEEAEPIAEAEPLEE